MKAIRVILVLFFIGFTVGCSTYNVKYDYDLQANFAEFKTFDWMQIPENAYMESLIVQRVKNAVNAELKAKGLIISSNNPDFLIAEHLGKKDKIRVSNWGYGYGSYGYGSYGRYRRYGGVSAYKYEEGVLILDFVDTKSKKLIWRGSATAVVQNVNTPKKKEKLINAAVKAILKKYPPSSSK